MIVIQIYLQELRSFLTFKRVKAQQRHRSPIIIQKFVQEMQQIVFIVNPMLKGRKPELPIETWLMWHHNRRDLCGARGLVLEVILSPGAFTLLYAVVIGALDDKLRPTALDTSH